MLVHHKSSTGQHRHSEARTSSNVTDFPANLDWRNMNGVNYMSSDRNQHSHQYNSSCWAYGVTAALSDRVNILLNNESPAPVNLSPQVLINCVGGGTCEGSDPGQAYEYLRDVGVSCFWCREK